jgi:hypothetical protein
MSSSSEPVPRGETAVLRYFQERMPYGLFVPDVQSRTAATRVRGGVTRAEYAVNHRTRQFPGG